MLSICIICINSSKVYCKYPCGAFIFMEGWGINSSKVYCKCSKRVNNPSVIAVLIVAKCIVNKYKNRTGLLKIIGINSSKVYCKYLVHLQVFLLLFLFIVAKCIVNLSVSTLSALIGPVLIVAKCIVNLR